jgi:hypothetical protein
VSRGSTCRFRASVLGALGGAVTPYTDVALPAGSNFSIRASFNGSVITGSLVVDGAVRASAALVFPATTVYYGAMLGSTPGAALTPSTSCMAAFSINGINFLNGTQVSLWSPLVFGSLPIFLDASMVCSRAGLAVVSKPFQPHSARPSEMEMTLVAASEGRQVMNLV